MDSKICINSDLGRTTFMRKWELEDSQELFQLIQINRTHLGKYLPFVEHTNSVEDSREFISGSIADFANGAKYEYGIFTGTCEGNAMLTGAVGVVNFTEKDEERTAEIGYWLSSDQQGKGITINCVRILIKKVHEKLKISRFIMKILGDNIKSKALAIKVGFVELGFCEPPVVINGVSFVLTEYELKL